MAPRKPKPRGTLKVPFDPPKVSKSKAKKADKTPKSRSKRIQGEPEPHRAKRYRNGLLNLEKTPAHLEAIVTRNATDSPLLRLPPEIRNTIWRLALSYELVKLPKLDGTKGGAVRFRHDRNVHVPNIGFTGNARHCEDVTSAFRLPEVCRQVYSETSLMAYSQSTFTFDFDSLRLCHHLKELKPAQKQAITSIELDPLAVHRYTVLNYEFYDFDVLGSFWKPLKKMYFPNLQKIIINQLALEVWKYHAFQWQVHVEDWKDFLTRSFSVREDPEVEIVIKDPDPSW